MKNFALIGAAGYIAPRHMKAIKDTGNNLIAAFDPFDSVGVIDSYFPDADFFTEFERFDRHLEKLKRKRVKVDYISVCSPNYLHDAHIRFGLRIGANVICEKPVVINPWNIDALQELEKEYPGNVYTILQLRLHPAIIELKQEVLNSDKVFEVDLNYITSRGKWYLHSWKGDENKSGGIATNIGIHLFDVLLWIFGDVIECETKCNSNTGAYGFLKMERANVNWNLSIDRNDLPEHIRNKGLTTFRSLTIDGKEFEFSDGFNDLHTLSYEEILKGNGFGIEQSKKAIDLVHRIRNFKK